MSRDFRFKSAREWPGSRRCGISELGHSATSRDVRVMSALPPNADIDRVKLNVRYGPEADLILCHPATYPGLG